MTAYAAGAYEKAADIADKNAQQYPSGRDSVIYKLEAARTAQVSKKYKVSIGYYNLVFDEVRPYLDTKAENSISEGVVTTAVNQSMAKYKTTPGERIMLDSFNAINYLATGNNDAARIELNRAADWQQNAVARYAKEIQKEQNAIRKDAKKRGLEEQAGKVPDNVKKAYADIENLAGYENYQNPFTSHLRGIFLMTCGTDDGDRSNARFDLRQVVATNPDSSIAVMDDLATLENSQRYATPPVTWVYFMTGLAPELEEIRLDIPIPVGDVHYVSAAFPQMKLHDNYIHYLDVRGTDGTSIHSTELVSMDRVLGSEFRQRLPTIIMQEIISAAGKAAVTYALSHSNNNNNTANLAGSLVGILYQAASTSADLRSWRTLPKEVQLCRLATPEDGILYLTAEGGRDLGTLTVVPHESNLVIVTMPTTEALTPAIMSIQLTGERAHPVLTRTDISRTQEEFEQ